MVDEIELSDVDGFRIGIDDGVGLVFGITFAVVGWRLRCCCDICMLINKRIF